MSKKLLKEGDVIRLEKGVTVYASLPENLVYRGAPFSEKIVRAKVELGEILCREEQTEEAVMAQVVDALKKRGSYDAAEADSIQVKTAERLVFDTSSLVGEYKVISTTCDGGGTQNGPNARGERYPDGHHVFCKKTSEPYTEVDFYQTGCFTAMIVDIEPI